MVHAAGSRIASGEEDDEVESFLSIAIQGDCREPTKESCFSVRQPDLHRIRGTFSPTTFSEPIENLVQRSLLFKFYDSEEVFDASS